MWSPELQQRNLPFTVQQESSLNKWYLGDWTLYVEKRWTLTPTSYLYINTNARCVTDQDVKGGIISMFSTLNLRSQH